MNIKTALSLANTLYGVEMKETEFEEIALNAWELIGNKHTELMGYIGDTQDCFLELPCTVNEIESVHIPLTDANTTSTVGDGLDVTSIAIEHYIDAIPSLDSPFYQKGKLVKYKKVGDTLQFAKDFNGVFVVYHRVLMDDSGLPLINDKEMRAIAAYVAYANTYKDGLRKRDSNIINLANVIKADWLQYCNAARVSSNITQNDMDAILDVKNSWERKKYGKSYRIR